MPHQDNPQDIGGVSLSPEELSLADSIAASGNPYAFWEYQTHAVATVLFKSQHGITAGQFRKSIEQLPTQVFKQTTYYEKWAYVLAQLCAEH